MGGGYDERIKNGVASMMGDDDVSLACVGMKLDEV